MPSKDQTARWQRFGIAIAVIVGIWGVVLPRIERLPHIQARIKHFEGHGVDPAALFYNDHEGMARWEASIQESRRRNPDAFW